MRQRTEEDPSSKTSNKISKIRKEALILTLAASAVFGVTACSSPEVSASPPTAAATVEAPTNTPDATPTPEAQPTTAAELVDAEGTPADFIELGTYVLLTPEKQTLMHSLAAMDKETFRAQPYEQQVSFCMQILDNIRPIVDYELKYNNVNDVLYAENATTGQELEDNNRYISIAASRLITKDDSGYAFDLGLAEKMASCVQDTRVTDEGLWDQTFAQQTAMNSWSFESMNEEFRATATGESVSTDGTLTVEIADLQGGTATKQYRQITYIDMVTDAPKTVWALIDAKQNS